MPDKIKVTKSTIHEGRLHQEGAVLEVGNGKGQVPRRHAEVLLDLEHAEEHAEPEPEKGNPETGSKSEGSKSEGAS